jgi:hypothetical protein
VEIYFERRSRVVQLVVPGKRKKYIFGRYLMVSPENENEIYFREVPGIDIGDFRVPYRCEPTRVK